MAPLKPQLEAAAAAHAQSSTDGVLTRQRGDAHGDEVKVLLKKHFATPVVLGEYTEKLHGGVTKKD